ncbi:MAG: beta-ketoacyl-[acyl-carrier-protein] synthase II, partial [Pseudomonadota bacterium]
MEIDVIEYESCSAAGLNLTQLRQALVNYESGLVKNCFPGSDIDTWIGKVDAIESTDSLGKWQSRNNALAALGLEQGNLLTTLSSLLTKYGATRCGVVMGSSTSSIDRTETAYTDLDENGALKSEYSQPLVHNP